jgi:hypothetical protein
MNPTQLNRWVRAVRPSPARAVRHVRQRSRLLAAAFALCLLSISACREPELSPATEASSFGALVYATPVEERTSFLGASGAPAAFVRISDILLMDDRTVVADEGDSSLRVFGTDGTQLVSMGRKGDGPGEFQALRRVWRYMGDSILTFDAFQDRATVWSLDGTPIRTIQVQAHENGLRYYALRGAFANGELVWSGSRNDWASSGVRPVQETIFITSATGSIERAFGPFDGELRTGRRSTFDLGEVPFTTRLLVTTRDSSILVANSGMMEIKVHSASGTTTDTFGAPLRAEAVTEEWREQDRRMRERYYRKGPPSPLRQERVAALATLAYPEAFPVISVLRTSEAGQVWVAQYALPSDSVPYASHAYPATVSRTWHVFSRAGTYLGVVRFPGGFLLLGVAENRVAGIRRDSLEVEHPVVYSLR